MWQHNLAMRSGEFLDPIGPKKGDGSGVEPPKPLVIN